MKKIMLVVPLLAAPLFTNCNNKNTNLPVKCHWYQYAGDSFLLVCEESFEYNNKGLLIKNTSQYVQNDIIEISEYEYDEKGNVTKETTTFTEGGKVVDDPTVIKYVYTYDEKGRITKKVEKEEYNTKIEEYTYEANLIDWKTFKYFEDDYPAKNIERTFEDGLYKTAVDSITERYYYYTWDEYKCNTKIEIYEGEGKISTNHISDDTYEYHKNIPNKIKKYVLTNYESGEIESNETHLTEYDERDRKTKISNYVNQDLISFWVYEYKG